MIGLGESDVWWAAATAFAVAMGGWFAIKTRMGATWLLRRARKGYIDWFREAVDEHVEPKFVQLRAENDAHDEGLRRRTSEIADDLAQATRDTAETIKLEAIATAEGVRQELLADTQNEEGVIRDTVVEVLAPLQGTVERHVKADEEAFARIEAKLETKEST